MFKRVLVPVKATRGSERAIDVASGMAIEHGTKIHIFTVKIEGMEDSLSNDMIKRFIGTCHNKGVNATFSEIMVNDQSDVAGKIVAFSEDFDLIIMGHCRYKKIYRFLHDSVAEEVLRFVKCPVMVTATDCPDKHASSQNV